MKKVKKIFITGATGFIGSNLTYKFLKEGYKVKLLVRKRRNQSVQERIYRVLFTDVCDNDKTEFKKFRNRIEVVEGDITQDSFLGISKREIEKLCREVGAVFHCAAFMSFDDYKREDLFRHNVDGTKNILDFMLKTDLPYFHYLSTAYVCGRELDIDIPEERLERPKIFNNAYEETKFESEKIIADYKTRYGLKVNIYRPSIVVGNSKTGKTQSLTGYYAVIRAMYILREKFVRRAGIQDENISEDKLTNGKLYLPLRVAWIKDRPLNLVPIDYVIDVIFEIFKREDLFNKIFYVIHPNPPIIKDVLKYTCDALNISTFQIIDAKDFLKNPKTLWERFFFKNVKEYAPYLEIPEPRFKDKNTAQVIKNGFSVPAIDASFISKLVTYCIQSNWRKDSNVSI